MSTTPAITEQMTEWWQHGVVYQVYIRSFADGNGDGQGDLAGLRSRLDHLAALGVDAVWINPWYVSPLKDGGYDVADYRNIDPRFGSVEEAEQFIAEAHERGIRVIADLVPNHTSSDHVWFQEAIAAPPGSPARDRYVIRPGKGPDGAEPPSNWEAVFGGPAWERLPDGEWYLHIFDTSQPDLNWEHPEVRAEFESIFRFWLDRGIDGFRVDVAHGMIKDLTFPDIDSKTELLESEHPIDHPHWDRDGVHEINRAWRAVLNEYENRMMVAEAWVHAERLPLYLREDEYHQSFNFDLLEAKWTADSFRRIISRSLDAAEAVGATSTWVLSNHDVVRHATRYGLPLDVKWRKWVTDGPHDALDEALGSRRARAAALITLALPGSTYVYQGEELGLHEVWELPDEVLDDPTWERSGHTERGRDGCRVPIPWETDGPSFGFGTTAPWLPQPDTFGPNSAAAQAGDPDSMLSLYQAAIALRKGRFAADRRLAMLDLGADVLAFTRGDDVTVIVNMGSEPIELPEGRLLLSSIPLEGGMLPSDAAVWLAG